MLTKSFLYLHVVSIVSADLWSAKIEMDMKVIVVNIGGAGTSSEGSLFCHFRKKY